ncbi:MAG: type II toxin-antitoxin system prevent-host-death family antitoxin [Rhodospirillales bacterium]|nr:MAG: type II toxin-antitoxin system prevent-host-death family antitoxin [Rhodospirillales bacterium]
MHEVGARQARTHLPELLKAAEAGETIVITRHGTPIARLVPALDRRDVDVREVIGRIERARMRRRRMSAEDILAARDEGRRG